MIYRNAEGALTSDEKSIVKALLAEGWRNQDIQALVNTGRRATINSARITEVKQDNTVVPASIGTVEYYKLTKRSYDRKTGLNLLENERLIRAREAMILAVQIFNSAGLNFKSEVFVVLANVAWTYLLHEYYEKKYGTIIGDDGRSMLLSQIIKRNDCPLSKGIKDNLKSIKEIRDAVEHTLLGIIDNRWLSFFQACCLNFDKTICDLFGQDLSLQNDLSFALQFAKPAIDDLALIQSYPVPAHIEALDARLQNGMTEQELDDLEYRFRVVYTLDSASKSRAHIHFLNPESGQAKEIRNILVKWKPADELYPLKPKQVAKIVSERTGKEFKPHIHAQAWKRFKVRPAQGAQKPDQTNREYCIYHAAHKDYTYSEKWVEFLIKEISDDETWQNLLKTRIGRNNF